MERMSYNMRCDFFNSIERELNEIGLTVRGVPCSMPESQILKKPKKEKVIDSQKINKKK